jgi:hypothetical protein
VRLNYLFAGKQNKFIAGKQKKFIAGSFITP